MGKNLKVLMERHIEPSKVEGKIKAPSSKSMTQRAIAAAMLSEGESTISNPSYCDDSLAAMSIAVGLGAKVNPGTSELKITGCGELKETKLNCGESGLAIRMFSPIAALFPAEITISGGGSLKKRPMSMIEEALSQLGVRCKSSGGFLPLKIHGPLKGGNLEIEGSVSSQLLTGLLMSLPVAANDSVIKVNNLKSKPYIDMTIQILKEFGINVQNDNYSIFHIRGNQTFKAQNYNVESDWSGGSFLLVAGAIGGHLEIEGLNSGSRQSDIAIITALEKAGARMNVEQGKIEISKSDLQCFDFDATESPDLFPPLVALASYCKGETRIKGVSRLVHKESDRASSLKEEFGRMNIKIDIADDVMSIKGGEVTGARDYSHDDHRIAMAVSVAALGANGRVSVKDSQCVTKSYPDFYEDLRHIGAIVYE
jgi:3-phosphoshikimate 1-carboxyvinyltransferase